MNLRTKMKRLEDAMHSNNSNPLLAGTHRYCCVVTIGGNNSGGREWVENTTTGERYEVTAEWRKHTRDAHQHTPPDVVVTIVGDHTTHHQPGA